MHYTLKSDKIKVMCLATPMKIVEIKESKAVVEAGDHSHIVDISLIKDAKIGDYILAHGEMAIHKIPKEEAEKILNIIKSCNIEH